MPWRQLIVLSDKREGATPVDAPDALWMHLMRLGDLGDLATELKSEMIVE